MLFIAYPYRWYHWAAQQSNRRRYLISCGLISIAISLMYYGYNILNRMLRTEQHVIQELSQKMHQINSAQEFNKQLVADIKDLRMRVDELTTMLSGSDHLSKLINALYSAGLSLIALDHPVNACQSLGDATSEIICTVKGTQQQLSSFFTLLKQQQSTAQCSQITINMNEQPWHITMHFDACISCAALAQVKEVLKK